jgi:hypothetical protein
MTGPNLFQSYAVPLVARDVSNEEVVKDIVEALQQLERTVDVVFNNIAARVTAEKKRVSDVNGRINTCKKLIESIHGSSKATTVGGRQTRPACTSARITQTDRFQGHCVRLLRPLCTPHPGNIYRPDCAVTILVVSACAADLFHGQVSRAGQTAVPLCPPPDRPAGHDRALDGEPPESHHGRTVTACAR